MAHTQASSGRVQRLTSLLATALVAFATALAFGRVFEGKGPTWQLVAVGVASAALAWALERRSLVLSTTVSFGVLVGVLGVIVFRETTFFGLPTLETLRAMGSAAAAVGEQARVQTAPTPPIDPLLLAGVVAVWASVFSCHALAFRAGSPLLALVPPVALVAFADTVLEEFVKPQYGVAFLVGALAIAFADGLRRVQAWGPVWSARRGVGGMLPGASRGGRRLAIAALAVAAIAPVAVPGFGSSGLVDVSEINRPDRLTVDPLVSVAAELNRDDPVEAFQVRTTQPAYLRMLTLDTFDGITWGRSIPTEETALIPSALLTSETGTRRIDTTATVTTDLGFPWVPVAAEPLLVSVPRSATWDPVSATITLDEPLDEQEAFSAKSTVVRPEIEELQAGQPADAADAGAYLGLPADLPPAIGDLAREWIAAAGAVTPYEQILAIQEELNNFTYTTEVDWRDDSMTLVHFLYDTRAGFCQQFASAMAVMLRAIGIPSRVAIGFTQGEPDVAEPDLWHVWSTDLHSWVEVLFPGHGWLAFEPTPGRTNPVATYQDPPLSEVCLGRVGCNRDGPIPPPEETPEPDVVPPLRQPRQDLAPLQDAIDGTAVGPGGGLGNVRRWFPLIVAGLVVGGLVLVPVARSLGRRRRLLRARGEPRRLVLATYDVLTQRADDLGLGRLAGETPDEYRRRIEATGRLDDGHLERLTRLTVRAAYAPDAIAQDDALDAEADARLVLRELRRSTPPLRRVAGIYRRRG